MELGPLVAGRGLMREKCMQHLRVHILRMKVAFGSAAAMGRGMAAANVARTEKASSNVGSGVLSWGLGLHGFRRWR